MEGVCLVRPLSIKRKKKVCLHPPLLSHTSVECWTGASRRLDMHQFGAQRLFWVATSTTSTIHSYTKSSLKSLKKIENIVTSFSFSQSTNQQMSRCQNPNDAVCPNHEPIILRKRKETSTFGEWSTMKVEAEVSFLRDFPLVFLHWPRNNRLSVTQHDSAFFVCSSKFWVWVCLGSSPIFRNLNLLSLKRSQK